jgi:hypothetical protein
MFDIGCMLHLEYDEIAEARKEVDPTVDVDTIRKAVNYMKVKLGAHSPAEVMLMILLYDTGARRHDAEYPQLSGLLKKLGETSLEDVNMPALLMTTDELQQQIIPAYHLSHRHETWDRVSAQFGLAGNSGFKIAERGIRVMRQNLLAQEMGQAALQIPGAKQ